MRGWKKQDRFGSVKPSSSDPKRCARRSGPQAPPPLFFLVSNGSSGTPRKRCSEMGRNAGCSASGWGSAPSLEWNLWGAPASAPWVPARPRLAGRHVAPPSGSCRTLSRAGAGAEAGLLPRAGPGRPLPCCPKSGSFRPPNLGAPPPSPPTPLSRMGLRSKGGSLPAMLGPALGRAPSPSFSGTPGSQRRGDPERSPRWRPRGSQRAKTPWDDAWVGALHCPNASSPRAPSPHATSDSFSGVPLRTPLRRN